MITSNRPVEREPASEPVEPLTPEQARAMVRRGMTDILAELESLKPHQYDQQTSADLHWLRRRARQIRDGA
jgi:hypothetical protein